MYGVSAANLPPMMPPSAFSSNSLSDSQREQVSDILSNFDLENMGAEDHNALRTQLHDAGIGPGKDLKEMLRAEGLQLPGSGEKGNRPPPPGGPSGVDQQKMEAVFSILGDYDLQNLSEDDEDNIQSALKEAGFDVDDSIFEILV